MLFGYNYEEIYLLFKKYANKIKYLDINNILKGIYGLIIKRKIIIKGLNSGRSLEKIINEACQKKGINNIKQINIPLLIPTVDLHTGGIYCFSSKNTRIKISNKITYIYDANIGKVVRASCSYPAIFSPCKYNKLDLIDGGIRENIPWKETKLMGADKVISVIFEKELNSNCCNNIVDVVSNSIDILSYELLNYEIEGVDYLLKIKTKNISLLDMEYMDELYELGYKTAKKNIKEIKNIVNKKF